MPDLTVMDGTRNDGEADLARAALEALVVELLRSLARVDHDHSPRVTKALVDFVEHASSAKTPLALLVSTTISNMRNKILAQPFDEDFYAKLNLILARALRATAELLAEDNAASGRYSQRVNALETAIQDYLRGREKRSRERG